MLESISHQARLSDDDDVGFVLAIVVVALVFDFINGFHDSANSIATVVSTRVLSPGVAVVWAAFFNFVAAFVVGTAVAKTIGKGLIEPSVVDPHRDPVPAGRRDRLGPRHLVRRACRLLVARAAWAGYGGAAIAKAGFAALHRCAAGSSRSCSSSCRRCSAWRLALGLTVALSWLLRARGPARVDRVFRRLQLVSAALYSLSHGANDAQKTMGIIVGLLVSTQALFVDETGWLRHLHVPTPTRFRSGSRSPRTRAIALGTALGGWRIVKTMGTPDHQAPAVRRLLRRDGGRDRDPHRLGARRFRSARRTRSPARSWASGAAQRVSAVRWGVAARIVWAWILTIPMSAAIAATAYLVLRK